MQIHTCSPNNSLPKVANHLLFKPQVAKVLAPKVVGCSPSLPEVANLFCYSSLDALRFATYGGEGGEGSKDS